MRTFDAYVTTNNDKTMQVFGLFCVTVNRGTKDITRFGNTIQDLQSAADAMTKLPRAKSRAILSFSTAAKAALMSPIGCAGGVCFSNFKP